MKKFILCILHRFIIHEALKTELLHNCVLPFLVLYFLICSFYLLNDFGVFVLRELEKQPAQAEVRLTSSVHCTSEYQ